MKIALSANGPDLDAQIGQRFGTAEYLLIVDPETESVEAIPGPAGSGQRGAGIQLISMAVSRGAETVLTGFCSPAICSQFESQGIKVITGLSGTVREAVDLYRQGLPEEQRTSTEGRQPKRGALDRAGFLHALMQSLRQFVNLLPVMLGVVLLIGLFNAFVSRDVLAAVFSGNPALDTLLGACFGSIFAGNPINSYIIGGELLDYGVSLFAVTAFILTWVTVGLVQLPAEIAALGKTFALLRNGISFVMSLIAALLTVLLLHLFGGGIL